MKNKKISTIELAKLIISANNVVAQTVEDEEIKRYNFFPEYYKDINIEEYDDYLSKDYDISYMEEGGEYGPDTIWNSLGEFLFYYKNNIWEVLEEIQLKVEVKNNITHIYYDEK